MRERDLLRLLVLTPAWIALLARMKLARYRSRIRRWLAGRTWLDIMALSVAAVLLAAIYALLLDFLRLR
jgi:hypothetical protein